MYADSIYTGHEGPHLIAPYTGINSPACMKHMNRVMSGLRISVEWSIGKAYAICGFLRRQEVSSSSLLCFFLKLLLLYSFKRLALALMLELPQVQNHRGTKIRGKLLTKYRLR